MTNETLDTIRSRRSCRSYQPTQITEEELSAVLEAGTYAASAMGRQSARILVVLADANARNAVQDGSLVMGNLMLAAASLGLGSCWINRAREMFDTPEGKALLRRWGVEGDWIGVGNCILGYPAADPKPAAPRKPDYILRVK